MVLMASGLNHQTAPLRLREQLMFDEEQASELISTLTKKKLVNEAVILSTCNRTELYCHAEQKKETFFWIADYKNLPWSEVEPYLYRFDDAGAVQHLLKVASGLDSMVIGEVEILGQIKSAYRWSLAADALGKYLDRLFQFTFSVAKQVRSETDIGLNPVSIASIAIRLADRIFSNLAEARVLLIGAGQTIRLAVEHLCTQGVRKIVLANRTLAKALDLKEQYGIDLLSLDALPNYLSEADIVISATTSVLPMIGKGMVERALKLRKRKPMVMLDLALPRDIEPEVGTLEDVYLYNLEDLQHQAFDNLNRRKEARALAEEIIDQAVMEFMGWCRSQSAFATVKALRQKWSDVKDQVLAKGLQQLSTGKMPEEVLQQTLDTLTNKLLHDPTLRLRQAGYDEEKELLFNTRKLFDLNDEIIDTN